MLILVVGITGNLGQKLAQVLLDRKHSVRGLGRNPDSLPESIRSHKACTGIDAAICAYSGIPILQLDGQLLLLRALERAGVKKYIAASWNYDFRKIQWRQQESYDPYIAFQRHAELSSTIKPNYILTGVLAEVFFAAPGHGDFAPKNNGLWDPESKTMHIWGSGDEVWHYTTEWDAAEFTARIIERDDVADGGFWSVASGVKTLVEIADIYSKTRGVKVDVQKKGDVEALKKNAFAARAKGNVANFWGYIGWFYQLWTVVPEGNWRLGDLDNEKLGYEGTPLNVFLEQNPEL